MSRVNLHPAERKGLKSRVKRAKKEGRCGDVSDQGLVCGMGKGHKGDHNALAHLVNPPPMDLGDDE